MNHCALLTCLVVCGIFSFPALAREADVAEGTHGMVVTVSAPATEVGVEVLKKGGNAVDAAVATAFALAVTWPEAGNIGGGGFMLVYPGHGQEPVVIDYRETAPAAVKPDTFAQTRSHLGHKIVGVPGTVRGLALAHRKYGKLPWADVVAPAVRLAEEGFIVNGRLANSLNDLVSKSQDFPELCRVYGKQGGWRGGDRLVQKDLARTLDRIAHHGPDAFYKGAIADQIVAEMKAGGGLITKADLAGYEAKLRTPLHVTYRGCDVYCPGAPAGGVCLAMELKILEHFPLKAKGRYSPETLHWMIEAMRQAFYWRAVYLGDPDFADVPAHLTSDEFTLQLAQGIKDRPRAFPSDKMGPDIRLADEAEHTTHFSIIDRDGLAVANTYTLEQSFGSRVVVRGAGFLLNNEMGDFNWRPGHTDRKGSIGTRANQVAPGKRMLSSQTPTIVVKNGKVLLVTGSPGARTIINTVLCVVLNVVEFDMDIRAAVDAPRLHHQWLPDRVDLEPGADGEQAAVADKLRALGHEVRLLREPQGDAHSIWVDPRTGRYYGAADHRRVGKAMGY
jgi:gamma-glutamyltranspeptidase/glutathione hydrolase